MSFNVGDKVRVAKGFAPKAGLFGEVTEVDEFDDDYPFKVLIDNDDWHWYAEHELTRVEEEPTFSVGDKVRVIGNSDGNPAYYHMVDIGAVVKVVSNDPGEAFPGTVEVCTSDGEDQWILTQDLELVEDALLASEQERDEALDKLSFEAAHDGTADLADEFPETTGDESPNLNEIDALKNQVEWLWTAIEYAATNVDFLVKLLKAKPADQDWTRDGIVGLKNYADGTE